jgi:linoleoyl-CoA desaturase
LNLKIKNHNKKVTKFALEKWQGGPMSEMNSQPEKGKTPDRLPVLQLQFSKDTSFQKELHRRVDEYFHKKRLSSRDSPLMYLKSLLILSLFATFYILLVFVAQNPCQAFPLSILLGFSVAEIGFNIQHDGGHNSYSKHALINKIAALMLDLIGASSYIWRWKHTIIHHRYVNITGYDTDIEVGWFARLSPYQKVRPFHRWQQYYLWPLYGLIAIKWHLFDDFRTLLTGKLYIHRIPRPQGLDLITFVAGKVVFFTLAFVIPLLYHSILAVAFFYGVSASVLGMAMSLVFQLPHCVEGADFPLPEKTSGRMKAPAAVHQVNVTLDFSRNNPFLTTQLGGLNYHMEHHLLPVVCHVHYPALTDIVRQTCKDFGIPCKEHRTFIEGLASHYRWLQKMGRGEDSTNSNVY